VDGTLSRAWQFMKRHVDGTLKGKGKGMWMAERKRHMDGTLLMAWQLMIRYA